jgi:hypothetical protein
MPPSGFEPAFPASERPQTHALDRAATGIGHVSLLVPDVGLMCSNTDTFSKENLLRFFQLGSMSFGCRLFFLFGPYIWVISVTVLCFINVLLLLFVVYIFTLLSFHFLSVIGFSVVNHLRKLLLLLLLFILVILSRIPDSLVIKSEYPFLSRTYAQHLLLKFIMCRK